MDLTPQIIRISVFTIFFLAMKHLDCVLLRSINGGSLLATHVFITVVEHKLGCSFLSWNFKMDFDTEDNNGLR